MTAQGVRDHVRARAQDRPGVYRWLGAGGRVLYVGKSIRLRTRLLSYFRRPQGKVARMMARVEAVAWDHWPTEFAALLEEMRQIRAWQPEYNVQHKRVGRHAFIKITLEPAPRLVPVTEPGTDGARYFGPLGRPGWLAGAVRDLSLALGLRDCPSNTQIHFDPSPKTRTCPAETKVQAPVRARGRASLCMRLDTGSCLAPCAGRCTVASYGERLAMAQRFLEARDRSLLDDLAAKQSAAARRLDFEYAAEIRDRIQRLECLWRRLSDVRGHVRRLNLVYPVPGFRGNDRVYLIRQGRVAADLARPRSARDHRRVRTRIGDVFGSPLTAGTHPGLSPDAAAETLLITAWFNRRPGERARAVAPRASNGS